MKTHKHDYYEYRAPFISGKRQSRRGKGGFVFCRNDPDCMHLLEPDAMTLFRRIVRSGRKPIIRVYPKTPRNGRQQVAIYAKKEKHAEKT